MSEQKALAKYETSTGEVTLTNDTVVKYLVNGNGKVTQQEVMMFVAMCKANKLNPFNKDAYLIKMGENQATMVVSKDVFFRRAISNPDYDGMKSGIYVQNSKGELEKRNGSIYLQGEVIIGAWCDVYRKSWSHAMSQDVNFNEFAGKKRDGNLNSNWAGKPAVMILKVAESTALRKAFTDETQGLYIQEEMDNTHAQIEQKDKEKNIDFTLKFAKLNQDIKNEAQAKLAEIGIEVYGDMLTDAQLETAKKVVNEVSKANKEKKEQAQEVEFVEKEKVMNLFGEEV